MKTKNFEEFLNEGTWAMSKDRHDYMKYIKKIEDLKSEMYNIIGDDEVFDGLDNTIERLKEMMNDI